MGKRNASISMGMTQAALFDRDADVAFERTLLHTAGKCYLCKLLWHEENDADGPCGTCGRPVCAACNGRLYPEVYGYVCGAGLVCESALLSRWWSIQNLVDHLNAKDYDYQREVLSEFLRDYSTVWSWAVKRYGGFDHGTTRKALEHAVRVAQEIVEGKKEAKTRRDQPKKASGQVVKCSRCGQQLSRDEIEIQEQAPVSPEEYVCRDCGDDGRICFVGYHDAKTPTHVCAGCEDVFCEEHCELQTVADGNAVWLCYPCQANDREVATFL